MTTPPQTTIGLFARGREIGFAVFERSELVRFGVKTVRGRKTVSRLRRIVPRLVRETIFDRTGRITLVVERCNDPASVGALRQTLDGAVRPELLTGIRIEPVSLAEVKHALCGHDDVTHLDLLEAVQTRFPLLRQPTKRAPLNGLPEGSTAILAASLAETFRRNRIREGRSGT